MPPICNNIHDSKETIKMVLSMERKVSATNKPSVSLHTRADPLQRKVLLCVRLHPHHPIKVPTLHPSSSSKPLDLHVRSRLHPLHQVRHESHQHGNELQRVLVFLLLIPVSQTHSFRTFQFFRKCIHDLRDLALLRSLLHHEQKHRLRPTSSPISPSPPRCMSCHPSPPRQPLSPRETPSETVRAVPRDPGVPRDDAGRRASARVPAAVFPPISSILPPTPPLPPTSLFPPILTTLPPRALPRKKVPPRLLREDPSWRETKKGGKRSTRKPAITGMKFPPLLREGGNSRGCEEWRHRGRKARVRYRDGVSAVGGKSWREWREFHRRVRHVPIPARKRGA